MKTIVKKIANLGVAFAVTAMLVLGSGAAAQADPVFASPNANAGQSFTLLVGESFNMDFTCTPPDGQVTTESNYKVGSIPPGMTWTNPGILSGAPTTVGEYSFGDWECRTQSSMTVGGPTYMTTIRVIDGTQATGTILIDPLNDKDCTVRFRGLMPLGADPGSARVSFSTEPLFLDPYVLTLPNVQTNEVFDFTVSMSKLWQLQYTGGVNAVAFGNTPNMCRTNVHVYFTYKHAGTTVHNSWYNVYPLMNATSKTGDMWLTPVAESECTVRILGTVPFPTDDNLFKVTVKDLNGGVDVFFNNVTPDSPLDVVLDYHSEESINQNPRVERTLFWGDPFVCGDAMFTAGTYMNGIGESVIPHSFIGNTAKCEPGSFGKVFSFSGITFRNCIPAPPGTFVDAANMVTDPIPCPNGYYSEGGASECIPAPSGTFVPNEGGYAPIVCGKGTYAALDGNSSCTPAAPGHYVDQEGQADQKPCELGTFQPNEGASFCLEAPKNTFVDQFASAAYTECPAGTSTEGYATDNAAGCLAAPIACEPGTHSPTGFAPCISSPAGYHAPNPGSVEATECPLGTFSADEGSINCTPAPKGYFVNKTGATSATKCATGLTTELPGARSIHECYKQKFQTAKAIKTPAKLKFGAKHETAGRADAGLALDAVATGSCTVTKITKTVKLNGKNVKQPRWVIKATKKAGNCKVTFSSPGDYTYKPFTVTKTIKVTKTGK
jgi:Tyrosine-protein kinase ephrin type A/B receptor-like